MDAKKAFEAYVDEYADKKNKELDENEQAEKAYRATSAASGSRNPTTERIR